MRKGLKDLINSYGLDKRFNIVSTPNVWDVFKNPESYLSDVGAVFLIGIHSHERNQIIKTCIRKGIRVYVIPRVGDLLMESAHPMHMFHLPILRAERYNPSVEYVACKRMFDIVSSAIVIALTSPIMIATAVVGIVILGLYDA
jgi:hypothetical protein